MKVFAAPPNAAAGSSWSHVQIQPDQRAGWHDRRVPSLRILRTLEVFLRASPALLHPKRVSRFIHIEVGLGVLLMRQLRAAGPFLRSFRPHTRQGKVTGGLVLSAVLLGGPVAWFVAVDWSWFIDECPDCGYSADVAQYRLLTFAVSEDVRAYPTLRQRIASDLGRPCYHRRLARWHKHRWWGLCHCAAPCWNGTVRIVFPESHAWYDTMSERVRAIGVENTELGREWYDRVIIGRDWNCAQSFYCELDAEAESEVALK